MVTAVTCRDLFVANDVDAAPSNLSWRWSGFENPKPLPYLVHVFPLITFGENVAKCEGVTKRLLLVHPPGGLLRPQNGALGLDLRPEFE